MSQASSSTSKTVSSQERRQKPHKDKENPSTLKNMANSNESTPIDVPYIIANPDNYSTMAKALKTLRVEFEAFNKNNRIKLVFKDETQYLLARFVLEKEKVDFYSSRMGSKPNKKAVIRGIPIEWTEDDIAKDLREQGCEVLNVTRMKSGVNRRPIPMVIVELTNPSCGTDIFKIRIIRRLTVKVEVPHEKGSNKSTDLNKSDIEIPAPVTDNDTQLAEASPAVIEFSQKLMEFNSAYLKLVATLKEPTKDPPKTPTKPEVPRIKSIKILSWNADGLHYKIDCLKSYIVENNIDVVLLSQTRLMPEDNFYIPKYTMIRTDSTVNKHRYGGTAVILRKSFKYEALPIEYNECFETTSIKLWVDDTLYIKIVAGGAFRFPLESDLDRIFDDDHPTIVLGNFRSRHISWDYRTCDKGEFIYEYANAEGVEIIVPSEILNDPVEFVLAKNFKYSHKAYELSALNSKYDPMIFEITDIDCANGPGLLPNPEIELAPNGIVQDSHFISDEIISLLADRMRGLLKKSIIELCSELAKK